MAAMRAQQQALAAKAQTEERTKTAELEEALVRSRQREQELTRQVQEEKRKQQIQKLEAQVAANADTTPCTGNQAPGTGARQDGGARAGAGEVTPEGAGADSTGARGC